MRRSLRIAIAALAVAAAPSFAVAKPKARNAMAQAPAAVDWGGFYAGVNLGAVTGEPMSQAPGGQFYNPINYPPGGPPQLSSATGAQTTWGAGAQFGYLRQADRLVYGYEVDFFRSGEASKETNRLLVAPISGVFYTSFGYQIDWLTTIRARGGLAVDRFFLYATGGLALGEIKTSPMSRFQVGANIYDGTRTTTRAGWTAGGGVEYALTDRISVRTEYLYVDLGNETYSYGDATGAVLSTGFNFTANVHHQFHIGRFGLNYRF